MPWADGTDCGSNRVCYSTNKSNFSSAYNLFPRLLFHQPQPMYKDSRITLLLKTYHGFPDILNNVKTLCFTSQYILLSLLYCPKKC